MSSFWPMRTVLAGMLPLVEGGLSGGFSVKRCSPPSGKYSGSVARTAEAPQLIKGFLRSPIDRRETVNRGTFQTETHDCKVFLD